ncbi:MAG: HDOD domain-containing protein [Candidatus Glassbacteria bacterium]
MYTIQELIELLISIRKLPTLSPVVIMLEKSLNVDEPDVSALSNIIADDPPTTSMILKLANSVIYGGRRTIATVNEAVVRLGFKELRKMVIDVSMVKFVAAMPTGLLDPINYWKHSIGVAICMEEIQNRFGVMDENGPQAHVVGLLHDIGRLITATYMPEIHQNVPEGATGLGKDEDIITIERERIGLDHAQIGAAVLERWGLPLQIVNCVRFHHEPEVCPKEQRKVTCLLYLSDCICRKAGIGDTGESYRESVEDRIWQTVGVPCEKGREIVPTVTEKVKMSEVLLSIGGLRS